MSAHEEDEAPDTGPVPSDGGPLVHVEDLEDPRLTAEDHHHLARVRRIRDGAALVIADGAGRWRRASMGGDRPRPGGPILSEPGGRPALAVGFALSKGDKPQWCVQKLTEIGIDRIVPFIAARSVVRWDERRRAGAHERLVRIAREAAAQSRRARIPEVEPITDWSDVAGRPDACRADRGGAPPTLDRPLVLVGPEGGWAADEVASALPVVGLGDGVLRAETAAVVAGGVLAALRAGLVAPADR